jgi:hypothetical protein
MANENTASRRWKISSGKIGSGCRFSTAMKTNKRNGLTAKSVKIRGCDHGSLEPPSSMGRSTVRIVKAKRIEPL